MPNYGLVVTPEYSPMTFQEYAAPFEKYAEVYNQMADQYDALEMEASKWEKLAKSQKDQEAYRKYQNYAEELKNAANSLFENGLSTKTRGLVSQMKKRYISDIQPIEEAYNYIQEKIKTQEQIKQKNPRVVFDTDFSTDVSITDVLNNPYMSYNYVDLDAVEEDATKAAAAQSSRNISITNNSLLGSAYRMMINGYAIPDIVSYINTYSSEYPEIHNLYNNLRTKYGSYGSQVDDAIITGMLQGYSANASPIQVDSINNNTPGGGGGDNLPQDNILTYYITAYDESGNERDFAVDDKKIYINDTERQKWYLKDAKGNLVKTEDGKPKWDDKSINLQRPKKLLMRQTSGNNYIITNELGLPYYENITSYNTADQYFDKNDMSVQQRQKHDSSKATTVTLQDGNVVKTTYNDAKTNYTGITKITDIKSIPLTLDPAVQQYIKNNIDFNTTEVYVGNTRRRWGDNVTGSTTELHLVPKTISTVGENSKQEQKNP